MSATLPWRQGSLRRTKRMKKRNKNGSSIWKGVVEFERDKETTAVFCTRPALSRRLLPHEISLGSHMSHYFRGKNERSQISQNTRVNFSLKRASLAQVLICVYK